MCKSKVILKTTIIVQDCKRMTGELLSFKQRINVTEGSYAELISKVCQLRNLPIQFNPVLTKCCVIKEIFWDLAILYLPNNFLQNHLP